MPPSTGGSVNSPTLMPLASADQLPCLKSQLKAWAPFSQVLHEARGWASSLDYLTCAPFTRVRSIVVLR